MKRVYVLFNINIAHSSCGLIFTFLLFTEALITCLPEIRTSISKLGYLRFAGITFPILRDLGTFKKKCNVHCYVFLFLSIHMKMVNLSKTKWIIRSEIKKKNSK